MFAIFSGAKSSNSAKTGESESAKELVEETAQIVDDYAKHIEKNPSPGIVFDVACLPHPKEAIAKALIMQSLYEPNLDRLGCLGGILVCLADYQEGVGPEPLFATGVDPRKGFDLSDLNALAKQIATYPHRERYKQFEALQNKDMNAFLGMFAQVKAERAKIGLRSS